MEVRRLSGHPTRSLIDPVVDWFMSTSSGTLAISADSNHDRTVIARSQRLWL